MSDERKLAIYDIRIGSLHGLPDVASTRPSTARTVVFLTGLSEVWTVQTYRQPEDGDTVFLERASAEGLDRIAIPSQVADMIARQRDALTKQVQRRNGKRIAAERKERGELPGFMKGKKR